MLKKYETPSILVVLLDDKDVLTASGPIPSGSGGSGGSTDPWGGEANSSRDIWRI